jgi:polypyrimidine tract-binding protein 2
MIHITPSRTLSYNTGRSFFIDMPDIWSYVPFIFQAHGDKSRDYTIPAGIIQGVLQPPGVQATSSGWQGNLQAAGAYAPPSAPAQSHNANGQVPNWNPGNSVYPPAPGTYPGQMYSSPSQYATSGGFPNTPSTTPLQYATSRGFPNTPSTAPPQYAASGGFPNTPTGAPPGSLPQQLHASQQMPPQHENQPQGTAGTSQPPPPASYYR